MKNSQRFVVRIHSVTGQITSTVEFRSRKSLKKHLERLGRRMGMNLTMPVKLALFNRVQLKLSEDISVPGLQTPFVCIRRCR